MPVRGITVPAAIHFGFVDQCAAFDHLQLVVDPFVVGGVVDLDGAAGGDPGEILSLMNSLYQNVTGKHLAGVTAILEKFFQKPP
jgi:hypothetical protein